MREAEEGGSVTRMPGLTFITLLAYDYRYSYMAIRSYYDIADEIILGLDAQRLSWMKTPFAIDMDELRAFIAEVDKGNKIRIVEGDFHSGDHPMKNDVGERQALSLAATPGNWLIQIDADEILLNAAEFKQWMVANNPVQYCVVARWITIFKVFGNEVLVIDPAGETVPVGTVLQGQYIAPRTTAQQKVLCPLQLLHFSWGRTGEELKQKLTNWSHAHDFDVNAFYRFWESLTLENFGQARNFHPLSGATWASLKRATINFSPNAPFAAPAKPSA